MQFSSVPIVMQARMFGAACVVLLLVVFERQALAQEAGVRLGRARLVPSFTVSNGIDTNVENDPYHPRQDYTADFRSNLNMQMPIGGMRVSGRTAAGYTYFREFASQRSFTTDSSVQWIIPLNRFGPHVSYSFMKARGRPNLEIDERVDHESSALTVGTGIRLSARTGLGIDVHKSRFVFGDNAQFLGASLPHTLNRRSERVEVSLTRQLTALTRMGVAVNTGRVIFDNVEGRRTTHYSIRPTVEFAPTALIRGTAEVGYVRFDVGSPTIPDFTGLMAAVDLASIIRGTTRLQVRASREVSASFSDTEPYYVQTGIAVSVGQRLTDVWDANVGVRREWLGYRMDSAYRPVIDPVVLLAPTATAQFAVIAGTGYRLRRLIGIGVSIEYVRREDGLRGEYDGVRASSTISYAF